MSLIDRLRPDLAALLKQDLKSAPKQPLEKTQTVATIGRGRAAESFADRISDKREVSAQAPGRVSTASEFESDLVMIERQHHTTFVKR